MRRAEKTKVVVTTYGMDGACGAALVFLRYPQARLVITSTSRGVATLAELAGHLGQGAQVLICGLGLEENRAPLLQALRDLKHQGVSLTWYCGRGYLDEAAEPLGEWCAINFAPGDSNAQIVCRQLELEAHPLSPQLLALAAQFAAKMEPDDPEQAWWHDYVQAAAGRYFQYGDESAYPTAIRKLAGLETLTAADRRLVEDWRRLGGRPLPVGNSRAMKRLRAQIARLGPVAEPVLILGPSGAGKELAARLLHEASPRAGRPFVPVNCAILSTSSDLAHDRLFGHKAGAYTGAREDGLGAFAAADEGTLFLDEVAELPLAVQTQLLRVLEEGAVLPLGTMTPQPVDTRIIAATNLNLNQRVTEGKFRLDLYHRLNVLSLFVPPLRERREDLRSLATVVSHQLQEKGYTLKLGPADWQAADSYDWPGNVRQFVNILKRMAYLKITMPEALAEEFHLAQSTEKSVSRAGQLGGSQLELFRPADVDSITPEAEIRKAYMRHCLELCNGSWTLAAHKLGVAVNTLRNWLAV